MKISELENIIIKNSSKLNITRGRKLLENKSFNIDVHKVDNFYNIYGRFKSEKNRKNYNPHLRIDLINEKLSFTKCNCSIFEEGDLKNRIYMCEHLVAAGLKFVQDVKKKLASKKNEVQRYDKKIIKELENTYLLYSEEKEKVLEKKEKLNINISLKEVKEENIKAFDVNIYIGHKQMYPVLNIKECIFAIKKKKEYCIGKGFVYDSTKYYFSENDEKVIEYIYEFIIIDTNNENKNSIRIPCDILRKFLENFHGKKIKLIYNYVNYLSDVINDDLPLSFTMKKISSDYVLTTKKIFPVPLNDNMDVFLYDRNLYMPDFKQIELYKILYNPLKEKKKIIFKGDINGSEFNTINKVLTSISKNVFYDKAIIEKMNEDIKINFNFSRKRGISVCDVRLKSSITDMSYAEALKINNDTISSSKKLINIESILNKYRFYFRNDVFEFLGNDEEYYTFLKEGIDEVGRIGNIFTDPYAQEYFKLNNGAFKEFSIKENAKGMYDFYMQLENISPYELNDVVKAYRENKSFIKLDDNIYVDLQSVEIEEVMKIIESLNLNTAAGRDKFELSVDKLYYLKDKAENDEILQSNRSKLLNMFETIEKKHDKKYEIPEILKCTLRDYQVEGYNWFKNLSNLGLGGILGDEMGLGKTVQTIAFLASERGGVSLIVVPTSLLYNWSDEFKKFAPDLNICVVHGEKSERKKRLENYMDYDVILTTYGMLKNDCEIYENIDFDKIILDEGQNIKNYKAQITSIVKRLKGINRFILTGTPIENNLNELWSLFDFIMPGYLYSNREFYDKFIKDESNISELRILIKPYILRRTKDESVEEMPQKHEKKILIKMPEEQKSIYDIFTKEIKEHMSEDKMNNITIFSYLTKLRLLCLDPSIVISDYRGEIGKFNEVLNIIKEYGNKNKILLFSQFTSALKNFAEVLDKENISYSYLDGGVSSANRMKLVEEFNNSDEKRIFLISLKAGGTGLNLTSANMIIHLDPWWNPSVEDQATDRAHRIGQKNDVQVIKLIAEGTIEEKILLLQEHKRNLINDVLTSDLNDNNVLNVITSRELIELLK